MNSRRYKTTKCPYCKKGVMKTFPNHRFHDKCHKKWRKEYQRNYQRKVRAELKKGFEVI